jgi:predicted dehydrogenase
MGKKEDNFNNTDKRDLKATGSKVKMGRRDVLKGIATLPIFGAFAYSYYKRRSHELLLKNNLRRGIGLSYDAPAPAYSPVVRENQIRLGIIGCGIRGTQLLRAAGFAHPAWMEEVKASAAVNRHDKRYEEYLAQEDLNVVITGVCDVFDVHAGVAIEAAVNTNKEGNIRSSAAYPKRYRHYQELIAAADVDAVIIATPDHWHGPMTIEAAKHGKHVYVEKPLTWTVEETYEVRKVIKDSGVIFQLGHQGRQTESYIKAREAVEAGLLGNVSLIEVCTNRNDPNGAWVYPIHPDANPNTIDWKQFIGPAPWHDFSLERFFRWRCWWDYSTGLNGDLLTHEYDAVNQIMKVGIPHSAMSSGGIYFYKDGRTVPDTLQVAYEFPKKDLTMLYSATLSSGKYRPKLFMGHDACMEVSDKLVVTAEEQSTRYKEKIASGEINPRYPIYNYTPGQKNVDAVTSATEQYFASRGLLYSYRDGKRVDTTYLHIAEWLDCIRSGQQPSCDIDQAFEEAMTAHMATISYHEKRMVFWDEDKELITL